uniref:OSJNBa0045O17.2 protein n=1 Tax=Oryza sativa subsp. japonica TaxID=39947 RepID=Q7X7L8_ORYSJ|nr:OSJNBb0003A12.17 [Oryza sativa Japonica Group]CAE04005.2 OSJNBa0045O17.2 [Oryza sativa Japonica Group]
MTRSISQAASLMREIIVEVVLEIINFQVMIGFTVILCDQSDRAVYAGDSMPRESICGDGPGVDLVVFGGLTGDSPAVRPATLQRSERLERGGTNNIKELRRDLFKKEYIKFEMKPGEALDDYLSRFNKILSNLRSVDSSYDANYPQSEISHHFLNGLDMSIWEMKVTSIQESVNMSTLTLDSLYTKLKTHEMNILARKVDFKSSALISSSTSLDVGASSSKSSVLALFNAMSDDQLEQFEEEDLVLLSNKFSRAMKNVRNRKRGEPNRCFEYGALDHLRSYCLKLGRGKKEDDGRVKEDDVNKKKNMKEKEKKKHCMQWLIQELIKVFDGSEDEDEGNGKQVVDLAFIARNASSDVDEFDDDNEEKLSYDQLEYAAYKFAKKLQTCSIVLDEKDHTIEILNAEIARLKSLIPNDDNCQSCEVLFFEIIALRDVNSINCKKLEFEIEKSKKLESSFALGFALHARVVDELILTKNVLKKIQSYFLCKFFGQCFMCK